MTRVFWLVALVISLTALRGLTMTERSCERGVLCHEFIKIKGNAYSYGLLVQFAQIDDATQRASTLIVFEDGRPLGPPHCDLGQIADVGLGCYLYWRSGMGTTLYLSTSDNTDPNTNGRKYTVSEPALRESSHMPSSLKP